MRLRLDLRRSSPRSCTGYGLAARFFGRGGGTTAAWPDFSSFRKNFWAWLLTCHHHARLHLCAGHVQTLNSSAHDRKTDKAYPRVKEKSQIAQTQKSESQWQKARSFLRGATGS